MQPHAALRCIMSLLLALIHTVVQFRMHHILRLSDGLSAFFLQHSEELKVMQQPLSTPPKPLLTQHNGFVLVAANKIAAVPNACKLMPAAPAAPPYLYFRVTLPICALTATGQTPQLVIFGVHPLQAQLSLGVVGTALPLSGCCAVTTGCCAFTSPCPAGPCSQHPCPLESWRPRC